MSKLTIVAATAFIAASTLASPAQALPAANLATASAELTSVQDVAWVCGRHRCWWQPNYYYYGYAPVVVAPRVYAPYAYRRAWVGPGYYGYGYGYRYRRGWW